MDVAELAEAFKEQPLLPTTQAQLMQRVQELMGQGIDVSSLFAVVVSSASTRDIPIKKAAYAFLARYGPTNEEICFLGINTLHQDCADPDPIVRALALRTICSLGQKNVLRFMLQPLHKGFQDKNAHVRNTAAMASITLFELDPAFVLESEIVDRLYGLIRDRDPQVVVSAILALDAILVDEGGIVINSSIAAYLLQRYKEWSVPQLQVVLNVLCRYKPPTDDEIYEIMNEVDDGIQSPSIAVQMATLRLFIWLCQDLYEIQGEVQKTIEETLLKHMESPVGDLVHASIQHLQLLVEATSTFREENIDRLSMIFCKAGDTSEIQRQKIRLCVMIAKVSSTEVSSRIVSHLCQVASLSSILRQLSSTRGQLDRQTIAANINTSRHAIEAIATIANDHYSRTNHPDHSSEPTNSVEQSIFATCQDYLFRLLASFSGMEDFSLPLSGSAGKHKADSTAGNSPARVSVEDLGLEDAYIARILSTLLTSIQGCWQRKFADRLDSGKTTAGVLDAYQIKTLGILLLRHLDQDELDRLSKKKKPLRFSYDSGVEPMSMSASLSSSQEDDHDLPSASEDPRGFTRIARINGIRMLLLEELTHQVNLKRRLDAEKLTMSLNDGSDGSERARQIETLMKTREQYALLLQQQVQDIIQSLGRARYPVRVLNNDYALKTIRTEQLATLQLACHLVAFSLELEISPTGDEGVLASRVRFLSQAVQALIPIPRSEPTTQDEDLLQLHSPVRPVNAVPTDPLLLSSSNKSRAGRLQGGTVSRDVADRARLIESIYLRPLTASLGLALEERPSGSGLPRDQHFDSPLFRTEAYRLKVKELFVARFGTQSRAGDLDLDSKVDSVAMDAPSTTLDIAENAHLDWLLQVGFNTLAVARERR
ncbi:AP-4 complex subunit beta-1 [Gryganskiella cystojenkinii]|nr:AP-4 complex subunit beta-1 [Gryganskiella cystojenkinii]